MEPLVDAWKRTFWPAWGKNVCENNLSSSQLIQFDHMKWLLETSIDYSILQLSMFCLWHYLEKKEYCSQAIDPIRIIVTRGTTNLTYPVFHPERKYMGPTDYPPETDVQRQQRKVIVRVAFRTWSHVVYQPRTVRRASKTYLSWYKGYSRNNEKDPSAVTDLADCAYEPSLHCRPISVKESCALLTSMSVRWRTWWDELRQGSDSSLKLPPSLTSAALIDGPKVFRSPLPPDSFYPSRYRFLDPVLLGIGFCC